jgi:hypothetical protein
MNNFSRRRVEKQFGDHQVEQKQRQDYLRADVEPTQCGDIFLSLSGNDDQLFFLPHPLH